MRKANVWAVVLAAGDGKRVQSHTLDHNGASIPKQFWRFDGRRSLLRATLQRAQNLVPAARIVPIVAEQHRQWWEPELRCLRRENIIVQPQNRGTAAGILLPLLHVYRSDPNARVVVLPSDHAVHNEKTLANALHAAVGALEQEPQAAILLGVAPDAPDTEYGWILPGARMEGGMHTVEAFVEKPSAALAHTLFAGGGLWNSFMMVAGVRALLDLFEASTPELLGLFLDVLADAPATSLEAMRGLYAVVPQRDFSRDVLQRSTATLRVFGVPACGWLDVGTPARLVTWQRELNATRALASCLASHEVRRAVA